MQTSNDKVYIITADNEDANYVYFHDKNGLSRKAEKGILRKSIYDVRLQKYQKIVPNSYIIFPYHNEGGKPKLIDIEKMRMEYPCTLEYLTAFKEELDRRNMAQPRTERNWYAYGRSQSLARFIDGEHLIWPVLSLDSNYVYDNNLVVFTGGGNGPFYGIEMKNGTSESIFYIQAVLNHWLMELLVKNSASTFRGGYYSHGKQFIAKLPIRRIDFTNESLKTIHDRIVDLVHQIERLNIRKNEAQNSAAKRAIERAAEAAQNEFIVGNPPFIRYQNFNEQYRTVAFELMRKHGFHPNRLTNIWLPFLLLSCEALSDNGRIGMVIPAELFQVDYAAEARNYLSSHFSSLTIITFKRLVFDDIQQEVILLLGEKESGHKGIRVVELDDLEDLIDHGQSCLDKAETKNLDHSNDKWVKYYLSNEELQILRMLNADSRISDATDLYEVNVGIVSGENDFFLSNWDGVVAHDLQAEMKPIISRAEQVKGIKLSAEEYRLLRDAGKRVYIFMPGDCPLDQLSESAQRYISWGEQQSFHKNYKCRIRKRWYVVPVSWTADAFLIRQANLYPKMILNPIGALVTDTLHKVRFFEGVDRNAVAGAFLNTYTFSLSETLGRSYGGGVLTFEPGEMRRMRIPMKGAEKLDIQKIDTLQRLGKYEEILSYTDEVLLIGGLGLSKHDVALLHSIWNKMRERRLSRKQRA